MYALPSIGTTFHQSKFKSDLSMQHSQRGIALSSIKPQGITYRGIGSFLTSRVSLPKMVQLRQQGSSHPGANSTQANTAMVRDSEAGELLELLKSLIAFSLQPVGG